MSALFTIPGQVVLDQSGEPMMGAKLYFYQIATSTPKPTYADAALNDAHENPVVADAFGKFPPIWLDSSSTDYRMTLKDQFDVEQYTIDGLLSQTTPADLLAALSTVDGAGSGLDADLLDGLDGAAYAKLASDETVTGEWNFTGEAPMIAGVPIGYLDIPLLDATASVELKLSHNGKGICSTGGGLVIPVTSDFPFEIGPFRRGHVTLFVNDSASNQQITAETPATTILHLAGTATTGTRTVAPLGIAVCYYYKDNNWAIYGVGVS